MRPVLFAFAAAVLLAGCRSSGELYPLRVGSKWSYEVQSNSGKAIQVFSVTRAIPVAGTEGVEIAGPSGASFLAWKNGWLYATRLPQLKANPPLPLLSQSSEASKEWQGSLWQAGRTSKATAKLTQAPEKQQWRGRDVKAIKVVLVISTAEKQLELTTSYLPGIGPISQTLRDGDSFVIGMTCVSGP